jgi:GH24 family phage-related lysozyme (muramidase)
MATNGNLPKSNLRQIYHPQHKVYLEKEAAASWNTMRIFIKHYLRIDIYPAGPISAYRTYEQQVEAKQIYGSNAATPGTSNHGWGLAVDLATQTMRSAIDRVGKSFGWAKEWSDASWEWWHLKYRPGVWKRRPNPGVNAKRPIAKHGSGGRGQKWYVRKIQRRLRAHGFPTKNSGGEFTKAMEHQVIDFQKSKNLKPDGVVGKKTWSKLLKKPVKSPEKPSKPSNKPNKGNLPSKSKTSLKTSLKGLKFIADFEGFYAEPYNDPVGYATVGYGHLLGYRPVKPSDKKSIWIKGQKTPGKLTEKEARQLLAQKLKEDYEPAINKLFEKGGHFEDKFTQEFYDSLVSFVYNLGAASLSGISGFETIGKAVKKGDKKAVAEAMLLYNKGGGKTLPGLVRRRKAEKRLALTGNYSTQI